MTCKHGGEILVDIPVVKLHGLDWVRLVGGCSLNVRLVGACCLNVCLVVDYQTLTMATIQRGKTHYN